MVSNPRNHRFPWWAAALLTCPLRRLVEDPKGTLRGLVKPGQVVLEVGPGNGFYSTHIAATLRNAGKLIAVDVQPQMLQMLTRRLQRRGLDSVLTTRLSGSNTLGLDDLRGAVDLVVVINVMHELPDPRTALVELSKVLRDNGQLLLVEPRGHVSRQWFQTELDYAREAGLLPLETPKGLSVVLTKRSTHTVDH